jgi:hypothetical protein
MDNTIITNPGDVVLLKIQNKEKQIGYYIKIIDVVADAYKKLWWSVNFCILTPTEDFKLIIRTLILDDNQIRGQSFTVNGVFHQLCKVEFPEKESYEKIQKDDPIPLPQLKKKPILRLVK